MLVAKYHAEPVEARLHKAQKRLPFGSLFKQSFSSN